MITNYKDIVEAKTKLRHRGYNKEYTFDIQNKCCRSNGHKFSPKDLCIIEYHRFQGARTESNPSIVIALEDTFSNKGILIVHDPIIKSGSFINFLEKVKIKLRTHVPKPMSGK